MHAAGFQRQISSDGVTSKPMQKSAEAKDRTNQFAMQCNRLRVQINHMTTPFPNTATKDTMDLSVQ